MISIIITLWILGSYTQLACFGLAVGCTIKAHLGFPVGCTAWKGHFGLTVGCTEKTSFGVAIDCIWSVFSGLAVGCTLPKS